MLYLHSKPPHDKNIAKFPAGFPPKHPTHTQLLVPMLLYPARPGNMPMDILKVQERSGDKKKSRPATSPFIIQTYGTSHNRPIVSMLCRF